MRLNEAQRVIRNAQYTAASTIQASFRGWRDRNGVIKLMQRDRAITRRKSVSEQKMIDMLKQRSALEQLTEVSKMRAAIESTTRSPWSALDRTRRPADPIGR